MIALEDRIRLELRAIGLLDDEGNSAVHLLHISVLNMLSYSFLDLDPADREDDEVCAELRLNQNLLRDQIAINNERRLKLIALVRPKMREHEEVYTFI